MSCRDKETRGEDVMKRFLGHLFVGALILLLTSGAVWAQATAQLNGKVTDSSGAVLPVHSTIKSTGGRSGVKSVRLPPAVQMYVPPQARTMSELGFGAPLRSSAAAS